MWSKGSWGVPGLGKAAGLGVILMLMVSLIGCAAAPSSEGKSQQEQVAAPTQGTVSAGLAQVAQNQAKKLSHQWKFILEVQDSRKASTEISEKAVQLQGYLVESQLSRQEDSMTAQLVVKVPEQQAASMVSYLEGLGDIKEEGKNSQDVSDEYYDTDARIKVLSQEEDRLLTFMKNDAGNIQDLLAVEKEVARVVGERESLQARMNILNNQVDYTSFTISLEESQAAALTPPKGTLGQAGQGFVNSLGLMMHFFSGLFILLVALLPWLLVLGVLGYLLRRFWWLRRKKKEKQD